MQQIIQRRPNVRSQPAAPARPTSAAATHHQTARSQRTRPARLACGKSAGARRTRDV